MNGRNYWKMRETIGKVLAVAIAAALITQLIIYILN